MNTLRVRNVLVAFVVISFGHLATGPLCHLSAEVPHLIRYQGQAVDASGTPLEGPYTLTFRLYDAETGGTKKWEEQQPNVPLTGGRFSVLLGQVTSLATTDWVQPCWLSVQVNGDSELSPRQRITSVPLAITAERLAVPVTTSTITDDNNTLVPQGAIVLWDGASCPAGYTRLTSYDDKFLVGSSVAGTTGGSLTHNHGGETGSHTLTIAEMPSHTHTATATATEAGGNGGVTGGTQNTSWDGTITTSAAGGGNGHTHTIAPADHRPPFTTILLCKKS